MKLISLNCRSLNPNNKRKLYFKKFLQFDICCLQECWVTHETAKIWQNEWSGRFFYHPGTSHSCGLIILLNKRFSAENVIELNINNRILGVNFTLHNKTFFIYNVYAPAAREEKQAFFEQLPDFLTPFDENHVNLICGDFNNLVDNNIDNIHGAPHPKKDVKAFNLFINNLNLIDTWRFQHPKIRDYSWIRIIRNKNNLNQDQNNLFSSITARRLDYIFCNNFSKQFLTKTEMSHFTSADHKSVTAYFSFDSLDFPRGPGYWKFNESNLEDQNFVDSMAIFINKYHNELLGKKELNKNEIWELLKIAIKEESISYSRNKAYNQTSSSKMLEELNAASNKLALDPENKLLINKVAKLTSKIEIFELSQSNGAMKRAKIKFIQEGEKNSKYFCQLEKSRQESKVIKELYDESGNLVNTPSKVILEISKYYKNLMNGQTVLDVNEQEFFLDTYLGNIDHPILAEEDKLNLEFPVALNEVYCGIKELNSESSPGCDGISPSFLLTFWEQIKIPLFDSFKYSISNKLLSISQRRAILTLLPKTKDPELLKYVSNYRPISVTTFDYRLYSKILAKRLQPLLHKLIHPNQIGYIPGRQLTDHIRTIDDVISYANNEKLKGMLVSLDFRKAFDTLSKSSILCALKRFNFGPQYIGYVETMLNGTMACVKNAGWLSGWFSTTRGVRQGCCLSPCLFILVVELLAIKIRHNPKIKGIMPQNISSYYQIKLLSYADDMSLFVQTKPCLRASLNDIEVFGTFSGLDLNRTKCIAMWLGRDKDNFPGGEGIKWLKKEEDLKIIGIFFNASIQASNNQNNWLPQIQSIKETISDWSRRQLSLWGKCLVAKMFLISKLTLVLQALVLPDPIINNIDDIIFGYLWRLSSNKNGFERLNRKTICKSIFEGGLGMIAVRDQQKVFLLKWLHKLNVKDKNDCHLKIVNHFFSHVGGLNYLMLCNINFKCFKGINRIQTHFWRQALISWLHYNHDSSNMIFDDLYIPLFNNSVINYKNNPLFFSKWIKKDIKYVKDLTIDGRIKSFTEIEEIIGRDGQLLFEYLAIKTAVLQIKIDIPGLEQKSKGEPDPYFLKLPNKNIRNIIINNQKKDLKCLELWKRKLNIDISIYFPLGRLATKESRLRLLHFKLIHHLYPSNVLLHKMNIKDNPFCESCSEVETLEHLFYLCPSLQGFWLYVNEIINLVLEESFTLTTISVLFGITSSDVNAPFKKICKANYVLLVAKMCISIRKCTNKKNILLIFETEMRLRQKDFFDSQNI